MEQNNNFKIKYPQINPGTEITDVEFHSDPVDLVSLFKIGQENPVKRIFVTDATVATLDVMKPFINKFKDDKCKNDVLIVLCAGEPFKTIESVLNIVQTALENNFTRKDLFIGIGGGVICDLTGFAASIYKRGALAQFVPTTLLAMVDASIGGKTGCDFRNYKNMIGAFYPAQKIHFYTDFLKTLSPEQYSSGLAEAFKTAMLYDKELYELFKNNSQKILQKDNQTILTLIQKCAKAKAKVVEEDFTEKNIRCYLNLGHTFGHALETIAGLGTITHGQAVAWGIGRAIDLSVKLDFCLDSYKQEIFKILESYNWMTSAVPNCVSGGGIGERLIEVMHKDKKNKSNKISLILQKGLNQTFIQEVEDSDILSVLK